MFNFSFSNLANGLQDVGGSRPLERQLLSSIVQVHFLAVGSQTEYTLQELPTGRVYRISVTAYITDGRESVCVIPT